ncbi:MAG: MBL fold metallo-hydrolase [Galactobacter sp.]
MSSPTESTSTASDPNESTPAPHIVTLGTAGGPRWWMGRDPARAGISTAVVVGDRWYLVDVGYGSGRQIRQAGLDLDRLGGVFITHLHSDHTIDLPSVMIFGLYELLGERGGTRIPVYGPGDRGMLPPVSPRAITPPTPAAPENPTPGVTGLMEGIVAAYATDLNDRIMDSLRPGPLQLFEPRDIALPDDIGYHPNENPTPTMEPFTIFEDDLVKVTAILVAHPPIAPAFAFRFDTAGGSVTISGDTREHANTARLAQGSDLLLHEAIDFDWVEDTYEGAPTEGALAARDHHYKSHTSVEGACRIAEQAGVGRLALHHIVPGHADDSVWAVGNDLLPGRFQVPNDLDVLPLRP